ncbi:MAG: FKBP-type peptidyl-prolyl cis-trans isomerase [Agarilytica sp.]
MSALSFDTDEHKVSYGIGRQWALQLAAQGFGGISPEHVAAAVIDALQDKDSAISENEIEEAYRAYDQKMKAAEAEAGQKLSAEGEVFLKENANKEGVVALESGLQYEVITTGEGEKPTADSKVKTHYHGTLINGDVFDSSVARGEPAEFPVNGVISGWTEALQLMNTGSKWRLFVPPHLAYGDRGAGGKIGPNATLVFEVELLEIVD